jgi:predicted RNA-binding Zn-ribbon protein involved in translation (DUF1610 family)
MGLKGFIILKWNGMAKIDKKADSGLVICPLCGHQFVDDLKNRADENGEISVCPKCFFQFI